MKNFILLFFLFITSTLFAQNPAYEDLMIFIPQNGNYTSFRNIKIPAIVKEYEPQIKTYLESKHEEIDKYYVHVDNVIYTTSNGREIGKEDFIWIPMYHIDTFWKLRAIKRNDEKKYNQLNNGTHTVYQMIGNASGKDGLLEINQTTGAIKMTLWE